jgi:5-methylcytosine-specific restriction endonuclease McrA
MPKKIKTREPNEKWCCGCQLFQPKSNFHVDKTRKSGIASWCKSCRKNHSLIDDVKKVTKERWRHICETGGLSFWSNKLGRRIKLYCSSNAIRQKYLRDPNCFYCRTPLKPIETHIDHMIPKSKGGSDLIINLVISCSDCNRLKHTRSVDDFLIFIQTYLVRFANKAEDQNKFSDCRERLNERAFIMSKRCESPISWENNHETLTEMINEQRQEVLWSLEVA